MNELAEIAQLAKKLNYAKFTRRIYQDIRGSLPTSSIPNGARSANKPDPQLDREDIRLLQLLAAYETAYSNAITALTAGHTHKALTHLRRCRTLETAVLPEDYLTAEQLQAHRERLARQASEDAAPTAIDCANSNCARPVKRTPDDRLRSGLCHRCYRYIQKHGYHRPASLCQQDIERAHTDSATTAPLTVVHSTHDG